MNPRSFQEGGDTKCDDEKWYADAGHVEQFKAPAYFLVWMFVGGFRDRDLDLMRLSLLCKMAGLPCIHLVCRLTDVRDT